MHTKLGRRAALVQPPPRALLRFWNDLLGSVTEVTNNVCKVFMKLSLCFLSVYSLTFVMLQHSSFESRPNVVFCWDGRSQHFLARRRPKLTWTTGSLKVTCSLVQYGAAPSLHQQGDRRKPRRRKGDYSTRIVVPWLYWPSELHETARLSCYPLTTCTVESKPESPLTLQAWKVTTPSLPLLHTWWNRLRQDILIYLFICQLEWPVTSAYISET